MRQHDLRRFAVATAARNDQQARRYLLVAALATLVLWFIPFAGVLTYPLRLFVTFIHEAGHALAAVLTLGEVRDIAIYPNTSGVTWTAGGSRLLVSSAGYVGTTLAAAGLLVAVRWLAPRFVLGALGVLMGLITLAWVRNPFGLVVGAGLAIALLAGARYLTAPWAQLAVAFLAIQAGMNALFDLRTILWLAGNGHAHNDAANLARDTGLPAFFWAGLWALVSVIVLWTAIKTYRRRPF